MSSDVDVAVVGAGIMGLAAARELARAGRDTVVLEQFELGHTRGSSHGGSRIVRLSYPSAPWVRLAQDAFPLWRELEAECGRPLLDLRGTLDLGTWQLNRDALDACGVASEGLDAAEAERRFGVRLERGEQGLYQADGGIALADLAHQAFAEGARAAGAEIREQTRVDSVEDDGDAVALDSIRARAVVVTAGAWVSSLVELETTPTRETTSYFSVPDPIPSVIDTAGGADHGYALVAPGAGLKAGLHQSGPVADPDEPGEADPDVVERTQVWVGRRFPGAELIRSETCLYTRRPGDEFVLERRGRVVVGSPCSGHGFKFAPLIGRRLAALATETL
jgi:sarcosine oxidase